MNKTYLPYVYRVTHKFTKQFYIGMRSSNKVVAEKDLGIHYFTSSKTIKNNFQNYDIQIIAYFQDWESAFLFENKLIEENWNDPLLLNKHYQKNTSSFSMKGSKRPDLSEYNSKYKKKPKELRTYNCCKCNKIFQIEEFIHHKTKENPYCSKSCSNKRPSKYKGQKLYHLHGRPTWNKGVPNPQAADNARKGAKKLSEKVKGRKRLYLSDGSWTWQYPTTSVTEQVGLSES
jgi:hypothetical protein